VCETSYTGTLCHFSQSCGKFFQACSNTLNGKFRGNGEVVAETFFSPSVKMFSHTDVKPEDD